jgi:hypothetical protein
MTTKAAALAIRKSGQKDAIAEKKQAHARDLYSSLLRPRVNCGLHGISRARWGRWLGLLLVLGRLLSHKRNDGAAAKSG